MLQKMVSSVVSLMGILSLITRRPYEVVNSVGLPCYCEMGRMMDTGWDWRKHFCKKDCTWMLCETACAS